MKRKFKKLNRKTIFGEVVKGPKRFGIMPNGNPPWQYRPQQSVQPDTMNKIVNPVIGTSYGFIRVVVHPSVGQAHFVDDLVNTFRYSPVKYDVEVYYDDGAKQGLSNERTHLQEFFNVLRGHTHNADLLYFGRGSKLCLRLPDYLPIVRNDAISRLWDVVCLRSNLSGDVATAASVTGRYMTSRMLQPNSYGILLNAKTVERLRNEIDNAPDGTVENFLFQTLIVKYQTRVAYHVPSLVETSIMERGKIVTPDPSLSSFDLRYVKEFMKSDKAPPELAKL